MALLPRVPSTQRLGLRSAARERIFDDGEMDEEKMRRRANE